MNVVRLAWQVLLFVCVPAAAGQTDSLSAVESAVLRDAVLCDGVFGEASTDPKAAAPDDVLYRLMERRRGALTHTAADDEVKPLKVALTVHGIRFTEIMPIAADGVEAVVSYSAAAHLGDFQGLMNALAARGAKVDQRPGLGGPRQQADWSATQLLGDRIKGYAISPGRMTDADTAPAASPPAGFSLMCSVRDTTAEEAQAAGIVTRWSVNKIVAQGGKQPRGWFDEVMSKGTPAARVELASYRYLEAAQVQALFDLGDARITHSLLYNAAVRPTAQQMDGVIADGRPGLVAQLIQRHRASLTPAQIQRLEALPASRQHLSLIRGGPQGASELRRVIQSGDDNAIRAALRQAALDEDGDARLALVDEVLDVGSTELRRAMSMNVKVAYTPAQIERMLNDPDRDVRIGILRRRDLALPPRLVQQGLNSPDEGLQFWYRQRAEAAATPEQLEAGLTLTSGPTRAGWAADKRYALSPSQLERALADPYEAVVNAVLNRHELQLSERQLDACAVHASVSIRFACVARPDFAMTYVRWLAMLTDWNANTWRAHAAKHTADEQQIADFLATAVRTASRQQLLQVAANRGPVFNAQQLAAAVAHPDADVRAAFCRRPEARTTPAAGEACRR